MNVDKVYFGITLAVVIILATILMLRSRQRDAPKRPPPPSPLMRQLAILHLRRLIAQQELERDQLRARYELLVAIQDVALNRQRYAESWRACSLRGGGGAPDYHNRHPGVSRATSGDDEHVVRDCAMPIRSCCDDLDRRRDDYFETQEWSDEDTDSDVEKYLQSIRHPDNLSHDPTPLNPSRPQSPVDPVSQPIERPPFPLQWWKCTTHDIYACPTPFCTLERRCHARTPSLRGGAGDDHPRKRVRWNSPVHEVIPEEDERGSAFAIAF
jgi:hypothetical protein